MDYPVTAVANTSMLFSSPQIWYSRSIIVSRFYRKNERNETLLLNREVCMKKKTLNAVNMKLIWCGLLPFLLFVRWCSDQIRRLLQRLWSSWAVVI